MFTYDLWYNLPGYQCLAHKISFEAPSSGECIALARMMWDTLAKQGYYLQARP